MVFRWLLWYFLVCMGSRVIIFRVLWRWYFRWFNAIELMEEEDRKRRGRSKARKGKDREGRRAQEREKGNTIDTIGNGICGTPCG